MNENVCVCDQVCVRKCVERVRGNLVLIVCSGCRGSLFVGAVRALAYNSR